MDFEWDPAKARSNRLKHAVDFAEAAVAIEDPHSRHMSDPDAKDEARFVALGMDGLGRILLTAYTHRNDAVRIISARKASKRERMQYEGFL